MKPPKNLKSFPSYAVPLEAFAGSLAQPQPPSLSHSSSVDSSSSSPEPLFQLISLIRVFLSFKMKSLSSFNYTDVKVAVFTQLFNIIKSSYEQAMISLSASTSSSSSLFSSSSPLPGVDLLFLFLVREALLFEVNTGYHEKVEKKVKK
jgi:hypothetical protein